MNPIEELREEMPYVLAIPPYKPEDRSELFIDFEDLGNGSIRTPYRWHLMIGAGRRPVVTAKRMHVDKAHKRIESA